MAGFDGLDVLVTGAATGLGAATAVGVARNGARRHEKKEEASELFDPDAQGLGEMWSGDPARGSHIPVPRPPRYSTLTR